KKDCVEEDEFRSYYSNPSQYFYLVQKTCKIELMIVYRRLGMRRRVVITGTGVVSPLGHDTETVWNHIKQGKSGIKRLDAEEYSDIPTRMAGYIEDFPGDTYLDKKEMKRYDRFIQYGYAGAAQ